MPDMYPDYEKVYERFVAKFADHSELSEDEKERSWMEFWDSKFNQIKKNEVEKRLAALVQEFAQNVMKKSEEEPILSQCPKSQQDTVEKTVALLSSLIPDFGVLGPGVHSLLTTMKERGLTTVNALKLLLDSDNLLLLEMALKKLSPSQKTLAEAPTRSLLEYAQKTVKEQAINLKAIAQASLGKDQVYVLQLIRTAVVIEGLEASNELINELFIRVCELHFNMAVT